MSSDPTAKGPRRNIRIGKYEVLAHVATGGMGTVYKARDTENGREVALKVLSPEKAAKLSTVERFHREAKHARKLRHENVVTLYEFGEANQTYFLTMEFIDGIDLHEYSNRKGALDPDEALDIILQGCRALDHAYRRGVIHRDIKPSNFLITRNGARTVIKLTDFGLAREASSEEFRVTRAGTTVGTLDYMAPEQARDSGLADIRSDLYALGSTWYHLLAGHPPFPKGGLGERLNRILNEEPPDVRQSNPRVTDATAAVLRRLMAKNPSQRYQTPAELRRDLKRLARGETLLTTRELPRELLANLACAEGETVAPSPPKGRRTPWPSRGRSQPDSEAGRSTAEVTTAEATTAAANGTARPYLWFGLAAAAILLASTCCVTPAVRFGLTAAAVVLVMGLVVARALRRFYLEQPVAGNMSDTDTSRNTPPVVPPFPPPDAKPRPNPQSGKTTSERRRR
ncbi:MAG TPA: serine/threonine-protein kinase [Gemmataceae bacterium]